MIDMETIDEKFHRLYEIMDQRMKDFMGNIDQYQEELEHLLRTPEKKPMKIMLPSLY
jgi:hypothetical protein